MNVTSFFVDTEIYEEKLIEYGFIKRGDSWFYKESIQNPFAVLVSYCKDQWNIKVIDQELDGIFLPFEGNLKGNVYSSIKDQAFEVLLDIKDKCCFKEDVLSSFLKELEKEITFVTSHPWVEGEKENDIVLSKKDTTKFFALVRKENEKYVIEIHMDPLRILELEDNAYIQMAKHSSPRHYLGLVLEDGYDKNLFIELLNESFEYTYPMKRRKKYRSHV